MGQGAMTRGDLQISAGLLYERAGFIALCESAKYNTIVAKMLKHSSTAKSLNLELLRAKAEKRLLTTSTHHTLASSA